MLSIFPIPAFTDNYIWCLHNNETAVVVDPGDANVVKQYLTANQLTLSAILITHHHADHIGGLRELLSDKIEVFGPVSQRIPHVTRALQDGEQLSLPELGLNLEVMEVPGHTREHIAYFDHDKLFCGDTMFSAGCGRLFEGTPEQMYRVFNRYRQLPPETKVYCTHEYTQDNIKFAESLLPDNAELKDFKNKINALRAAGKPSLPSTLAQEIRTNPYMLTSNKEMLTALTAITGTTPQNEIAAFAAIRKLKDNF